MPHQVTLTINGFGTYLLGHAYEEDLGEDVALLSVPRRRQGHLIVQRPVSALVVVVIGGGGDDDDRDHDNAVRRRMIKRLTKMMILVVMITLMRRSASFASYLRLADSRLSHNAHQPSAVHLHHSTGRLRDPVIH
jgi:hypothetical protein